MFDCPLPISDYPEILMAHGGGGRLSQRLIRDLFAAAFEPLGLQSHSDSAVLSLPTGELAFTTDSFVVRPRVFPGGTIGSLAVHGTVNDLAMQAARPLALSAAFILEEGLAITELWDIVQDMAAAARRAGVSIVTGDTKVVDRGHGDGVYITTSGIGHRAWLVTVGPEQIRTGDVLIVSGDLGRHGIAIMTARGSLQFESAIGSDSAALNEPVAALLDAGIVPHAMRDLTRGGLASATNELAADAGLRFDLERKAIPVHPTVEAACELLGLDPLYVANEGRFLLVLPADAAARALRILHDHELTAGARSIGTVREAERPVVTIRYELGVIRVLDMLSGEQLPRIC